MVERVPTILVCYLYMLLFFGQEIHALLQQGRCFVRVLMKRGLGVIQEAYHPLIELELLLAAGLRK